MIEYDDGLINNLKEASPDAAFPIVQGKHHSDGAVQSILALCGIPYVGSRPQAAALINHKTVCKRIWRAAGILTPDFFEYSLAEYENDDFDSFVNKAKAYGLGLPVVVKPPTQGGRFGMVFVNDVSSFQELAGSFRYDEILLAERYVAGRFFTQGLIEIDGVITALPPVEVIDNATAEFQLFSGDITVTDHDFSPARLDEISRTTLLAAALTGASGFARLDYHLSDGKLYLLEINAAPGVMPGYSSLNKCAAAAGYDYHALIGMLLAAAKR
jgi:D-alanine-D-alanine ligase